MVVRDFVRDERGQLVGTPLKLVIAVVIGVAVLGILLQMMNLVSVMNPHSFNVEVSDLGSDGAFALTQTSVVFTVKDENDGRLVQGAIVEIKGAGETDAQVTSNQGRASFNNLDFDLAGAEFAKITVSVTKEGYSRWTNTYLVKN